jgi:hypothetical protein
LINIHCIYEWVEIPVASYWRPEVDKTLVTSNLESIRVTNNVNMLYYTYFKITTHKMRVFDDVLVFSIRMLKIIIG